MYKLWEFIRSIYVVVLFVLLEVLAVSYYARSTRYTRARLLVQSSRLAGGVSGVVAGVRRYFTLGRENDVLLARVAVLEEQVASYKTLPVLPADSCSAIAVLPSCRVMPARIVSNTINRMQNFITLDRGRRDGVVGQMAVLSPEGAMVGYVIDCSDHYAVAVSALNTSFRASGKLVGSDYFGSIYWDGADQHVVVMDEVSKYADPQPGQEVVSTGFSLYFPAGVMIGTVESAELNETRTAYVVRVRLAAAISRLSHVLLIENLGLDQARELQAGDKVKQFSRH